MKRFRELREELLNEGGGDMMPADEMTISELKIACYAANNILERLENGAMIQRWQISAIVKAKEELASVYTSISADEMDMDDMDDYDDMEDEEEPMYVGFEYPSMYGEATEVGKAGPAKLVSYGPKGDKVTASKIAGHIAKRANDYKGGNAELVKKLSSEVAKHGDTTANELIGKHKTIAKNIGMDAKAAHNLISGAASALKEEVDLDEASYRDIGAQNMMRASRKADKEVDKMRAQAAKRAEKEAAKKKSVEEETDYKVTVDGLPDMYVKADSPSAVKNSLRKVVKNPEMIKNVERIAKASLQKMFRDKAAGKEEVSEEVELDEAKYVKTTPGHLQRTADKIGATWDKEKQSYFKLGSRIGYTKLKSRPGESYSYDHFIHSKLKEETDLEEGYNDPIHRKYISDTVHDFVPKDDPKHDKIVDHLHKAKNFGTKTKDDLETAADITVGAAHRITKAVADNLKANFGSPNKTQTQAQRIGAYLKQKQIGPRK